MLPLLNVEGTEYLETSQNKARERMCRLICQCKDIYSIGVQGKVVASRKVPKTIAIKQSLHLTRISYILCKFILN